MPSKRPTARTKRQKHNPSEHRFKIDAYTPATMPMARLAEYIARLAAILGESKDVHLVALEPGSTVLVQHIEHEAIPKVHDRADAVRRGDAPRDAIDAFRHINQMLREDNGRAVFRRGIRGRKILIFPGRDEAAEDYPTVKQYGTVHGHVMRVGGTGDSIPVLLEAEGRQITGCHTSRQIAKRLATALFEPVRLSGMGYWERNAEGEWSMKHFRIDAFEQVEAEPLSVAVAKLRAVGSELDGSASDIISIRRGRA